MRGYEVRTSCEVSPSVTSDGTASVSTVEAVCVFINNMKAPRVLMSRWRCQSYIT